LDRFLSHLSHSQHPVLARPRDFVKRNTVVHAAVRGLLKPAFLVRRIGQLLRHPSHLAFILRSSLGPVSRLIWPPAFSRKAVALANARARGGAISLQELDLLWEAAARCWRVLCIAEGPELEQLRILLRARRVKVDALPPPSGGRSERRLPARKFDLIVTVGNGDAVDGVKHLRRDVGRSPGVVIVGRAGSIGEKYPIPPHSVTAAARSPGNELAQGIRLKVLLLNDIGFQYGGRYRAQKTSGVVSAQWVGCRPHGMESGRR
jgi:hypothetical protein